MTLTKNDIVEALQGQLDLSRRRSVELVELLLEIIKRSLESRDEVLISGFGKFCIKEKEARRGRNPATGMDMVLDSRKVVTFKCSTVLRGRINRNSDDSN